MIRRILPTVPPVADPATFRAGRDAVHALNFFTAAMQTGFGPFVSVWLVSQGWSLTEVGLSLSVGTIAALCAQLPGGALVDLTHRKRAITGVAITVLSISAVMIAVAPTLPAIWAAQVLHAFGSAIVTPAIAALTLSLSGPDSFSERLGGNARYASVGGALAAGAFGLASSHTGERSIFIITAVLALPAIASLFAIRQAPSPPDLTDHMALAHPKERDTWPWAVFRDPTMHVFALCIVMFQFGNAALLPLALGGLSQRNEALGFVVPVAIIVPQLVVALASPWAGEMARGGAEEIAVGRLPRAAGPGGAVRVNPGPEAVDVIQVLDGVSATVVGLMLPLIAADLTAKTGHLNLTIGSFGLAAGLGATFSTSVAGFVADRLGGEMAFLGLALVGGLATTLLAVAMPETRPVNEASTAEAPA